MAFTSRRLLPETLSNVYSSYSSLTPSPSPSPSHLQPDAITCFFSFHCGWPYFSPPPPSSSSRSLPWFLHPPTSNRSSSRLSTAGIFAVSLVSSLFLLLVCFFFLARYRHNRHRHNVSGPRQGPLPGDSDRWEEEALNENRAIIHPIWLIDTEGLEPAVIEAISVCVYRKGEGLIEGDYCSICLSEFEEGEGLRLLPKCSHAFHLPCIDTWLCSHTNCPLCRASILSPALASASVAVLDQVESGSGTGEDQGENTSGGDLVVDGAGDSSDAAGEGAGEEGFNDKTVTEDVGVGVGGRASVGRRSVSMDTNASSIANEDGEVNRRGRVGGVRSLS